MLLRYQDGSKVYNDRGILRGYDVVGSCESITPDSINRRLPWGQPGRKLIRRNDRG